MIWLFRFIVLAAVFCLQGIALQAAYKDDIRHAELVAALNQNGVPVPTGGGVSVTQVEPIRTSGGADYMPDTASPEFNGKTITDQSGGGTASDHATTVGRNFYGNSTSIAPGITSVDVFSANDWLNNLGWLNGTPAVEVNPLQNHSWIAETDTNDASLRMDYAVTRDGFLPLAGLNNGSSTTVPDTYGSIYNGITVGVSDGDHSRGGTVYDISGRVKPEIVAPNAFTSFATPYVSAAAAMLIEAAGSEAAAKDQLTLKAILLAAANKSPFPDWDQSYNRPIDEIYGAGQLDVFEAYFIQNAGQQAAGGTMNERGWNLASLNTNASHTYGIKVPEGFGLRNFSALLTWNREVSRTESGRGRFTTVSYDPSLADMSLELKAAGASSIYLSDSSVDNLEHIWRDAGNALGPGEYTLTVATDLAAEYAIAWRSELYQDYELWQAAAFTTTPLQDQGPTDDPDFDGIVNLLEQAFGGDPENHDPENLPQLLLVEENGENYLEIRYRRPTYDNGLAYTPQTVSALTDTWSSSAADIQLQSITPDTDDFEWHTYRRVSPVSSDPQGFIRVEVTQNLL